MDAWCLIQTLSFWICMSSSSCAAVIPFGYRNASVLPASAEVRTEYYEVGKEVSLSCNNVTWTNALYYIWNINTTSGVQCFMSEGANKRSYNNCTGGKMLLNTTGGETYLYIPSFALTDEGMYTCETAYRGGAYKAIIAVGVKVHPVLFGRLEHVEGLLFAVCSAVVRSSEKAPVLLWKGMWSSLEVRQRSTTNTDGTITIESWLALPDDALLDLTCVANHPSWTQEASVTIDTIKEPSAEPRAAELKLIITMLSVIIFSSVIITTLCTYMYLQRKSKRKIRIPKYPQ
ncbi:cell surface glycoprotein CD200 receptor 1-A-like [Engraulis encrasicolus]|uniref:cell surface glycoprotein CD200 receptor 1-A-like n=1 Tax=Engraulis encrasicolus TaxID=184585 RepID=UPI002FD75200